MSDNETFENLKEKHLKSYRIIVWNADNVNKSEIARRLYIHRMEVYRILEKFEAHGRVELDLRTVNSGRTPLFDEEAKEIERREEKRLRD